MSGYGYTHDGLPGSEVKTLPGKVCGHPAYVIGQTVGEIAFEELSDGQLAELWPEGQAFGPEAEVRWEQAEQSDVYRVLVLAEKLCEPCESWQKKSFETRTTLEDDSPLHVYLLGVWQPKGKLPQATEGAWIEVRIPKPLPYPVRPDDSAKMHRIYAPAVEYSLDGVVRYIRLKGLQVEPLKED